MGIDALLGRGGLGCQDAEVNIRFSLKGPAASAGPSVRWAHELTPSAAPMLISRRRSGPQPGYPARSIIGGRFAGSARGLPALPQDRAIELLHRQALTAGMAAIGKRAAQPAMDNAETRRRSPFRG